MDTLTLMVALIICNVLVILLLLASMKRTDPPQVRTHIVGLSLITLSYAFMIARLAIPERISAFAGNSALLFGWMFEILALYATIDRLTSRLKLITIGITVSCVVALGAVTFATDDFRLRVVLISVEGGLLTAYPAYALLKYRRASRIKLLLGMAMALVGITNVVRVAYALSSSGPQSLFQDDPSQSLAISMFFLFTVIGGIGMFLLAKEQKEEQLYIAATRDSLTGVLNRATLFESAASSISMCARNGIGFALAIIDIDNLKAVNDSCGHAAGDDLIRNFAQTVRREIRGYDHFGRIGGDEFVVMFQGVDEELLRSILERCRQSLLEVDNCTISATVTIGAVCVEKPKGLALSLDTLMKDCDRALYEGKDAGRDRVVVTRLDGPGISAP